jgi:poly(A) polymerase Pap1
VTDPISTAGPVARDLELTAKLEALLRAMNQFEPAQESQEREEALGQINALIKEWMHKASLKKVRLRCFFVTFSAELFPCIFRYGILWQIFSIGFK